MTSVIKPLFWDYFERQAEGHSRQIKAGMPDFIGGFEELYPLKICTRGINRQKQILRPQGRPKVQVETYIPQIYLAPGAGNLT